MKETTCLSSEYDIEDYGKVVFSDMPKANSAEFRSCRSMISFEYLGKTAKDFNWGLYEDDDPDVALGRKWSNAFILNFQKFRKEGKGFFVYSRTKGSGKTFLSICLANEVMRRYDVNVKFISILDYLDLTKKDYNSMADKEEKDCIVRATVLILDDIGVEVRREWVNTTLYQLINYRYLNKLITIYTSNYTIEELKVDERIKDRINSMCIPLHIPEVSVRSIEADKANNEFIQEVFET